MPTIQAPRQQAPMEVANPAQRQQSSGAVVAQQPKSEAMMAENDLSLRGGDLSVGCHERCCGINCSWYKGCC